MNAINPGLLIILSLFVFVAFILIFVFLEGVMRNTARVRMHNKQMELEIEKERTKQKELDNKRA